MARAFVALLLIELHFPDAGSLKAKRKELQSVKAQLRGRMNISVAEVDHHDLWQRSTLAASLTAGSVSALEEAADGVERWLHARLPDGVFVQRTIHSYEDVQG